MLSYSINFAFLKIAAGLLHNIIKILHGKIVNFDFPFFKENKKITDSITRVENKHLSKISIVGHDFYTFLGS